MNTGHVTLALDEILCRLTPEQAETLRAGVPTWFRDQADAAADEIATNLLTAQQAGIVGEAPQMPTHQHPAWVRLSVIDTLVKWWAGQNDSCLHAPHPMRPQPVCSVAWKPGLIVCGDCTHLLDIPRNSAADRTCDGCGKVTAGLEAGDPIYPFTVVCGVLSHGVGVCGDCRYLEAP